VGQIGRDTGSVDNIEQGELVDERGDLAEERQWLANATRGTENNSFHHIDGMG